MIHRVPVSLERVGLRALPAAFEAGIRARRRPPEWRRPAIRA